MKQLENWFLTNDLIINMEKTKVVLSEGRGSGLIHRPILDLNNKEITYLSNLKFIGIYVTEKLSWATHMQYLCQKLNKARYLSKSLWDSISIPVLRNVYFTKFESVILYFWGE
jgi:hypothetical protein